MRIRLLNLLLLSVLGLAAARLVGFLREPPPALPPIAAEAPPAAAGTAAADQEPAPGEPRPETFDVIVARDLFSPTRGVVQPAPAAAAKPAPRAQPPPKLTLYGVVILDGEKSAFLHEGGQEARPKKVREKESIAGGIVTSIRPDGVTFLFGGSEIAIPLRVPKEAPAVRATATGAAAAAAARSRAAAAARRRSGQQPMVPGQPGQMPIGGAQMGAPGPAGEDPAATGMPVFPVPAEPPADFGQEEEVLLEDTFDGGEDPDMGNGEGVE